MRLDAGPRWPLYDAQLKHVVIENADDQDYLNPGLSFGLTDNFELGFVYPIQLTPEDRENIARVMLVPDDVWLDIHKWGIKDNNLQEYQCGIAHTLVAYAAGGWAKVPSRKQARCAVEIIEAATGNVPSLDSLGRRARQNA